MIIFILPQTTDSLTSLHQVTKQLSNLEKHRHHVQGDLRKILSNTNRTLNPTSSFIKEILMPELPEMNLQMPLQNA